MVTRYDAQYDVHDLLVKNLPEVKKEKNSNPKKSKKTKSVKT